MFIIIKKVLGIDLGTTNSCVSVVLNGEYHVIDIDGIRTVPSIVSFSKDGKVLIGKAAIRNAVIAPQTTIFAVKRLINKTYDSLSKEDIASVPYKIVKINNGLSGIEIETTKGKEVYDPVVISAKILSYLKESAETQINTKYDQAVITVPAYFNDLERTATINAGKIAKLEVLRIINEPTAAAIAYGITKNKDQIKKIVIYDLGGGTFDVTVIEIDSGVLEVKATGGNTRLGGEDYDNILIKDIYEKLLKQYKSFESKLREASVIIKIKEAAEQAKKDLTTQIEVTVSIPYLFYNGSEIINFEYFITRQKYEQIVTHLTDTTLKVLEETIENSKIKKSEINEVLLVGGITKTPSIIKKVEEYFGIKIERKVNPDESVSIGAAIQGDILSGDTENKQAQDILLVDVIPLSLGIETKGGIFTAIIEKNSSIPIKKSEVFTTAENNQPSVILKIFQGVRPFVRDNRLLGEFQLQGIKPQPAGIPKIEVTFDIDANGRLNVTAKDLNSGLSNNIEIKETGTGIDQDEIDRYIREAEQNKEEDEKQAELVKKYNEYQSLYLQIKKIYEEIKPNITEEQKVKFQEDLDKFSKEEIELSNVKDINQIEEKLNELKQFQHKLLTEVKIKPESENNNEKDFSNNEKKENDFNNNDNGNTDSENKKDN